MTVANQEMHTGDSFSANALTCIRNDVMLFNELEFNLEGGTILQIQGPNGSGKTSLLRILCGLALPDAGKVQWNGKNIQDCRQDYLKEVSYIGHVNGIKMELTALENLAIARSLSLAEKYISPLEVLKKMGLAEYNDTPARNLSSGQRRRLALARLLINSSRLWILDEPFTALDDNGRQLMQDIISDHAMSHGITVLATHDPLDVQKHNLKVINL